MLALAYCVSSASASFAHGGGLDAYGCHHNRKAGGYHCHQGPLSGQAFGSQGEAIEALEGAGSKPRLRQEPHKPNAWDKLYRLR